MKPFDLGAKVFMSHYGRHEKWVTCPDCLGSKTIRVILGDETELTIECGGCNPGGFRPPTGMIPQYDYETLVVERTVTGVKVTRDSVEYELDNFGSSSYYTGTTENTFATKEEALAHGELSRQAREAEENRRFMAKTIIRGHRTRLIIAGASKRPRGSLSTIAQNCKSVKPRAKKRYDPIPL